MSKFSTKISEYRGQVRLLTVVGGCLTLAIAISYVLYGYTETLLKQRLQERLTAIVATAALQIQSEDISSINSIDDLDTAAMRRVVDVLNQVRDANPDITYAYLMRRTDDINTFAFIADADSLIEPTEEDLNNDGVADNLEGIPMPGDPFDVSEYPTLRDEAFYHPVAASELEEDEWSIQLSAYAPIFDANDNAAAIIGIDVTINDFKQRTQAMLLPFLLFIFFLVFLITMLTYMLMKISNERVEEVKELDRQKDELLSIVSHQLATPVSSMSWYLEMMLDGDFGELKQEQQAHVKSLQSTAKNLADLVHMILDVSRIQLGRMKVDRTSLPLNEFFSEILDVIKAKADERNVDLKLNIPSDLPTSYLDKRLMRMTLENLLSNAVKYSNNEHGVVEFNVQIKDNALHYSVVDNGCGIPKSEQSKIFGKLFRASNVQRIDGNGFGLYAAKGAVEALGGNIKFESTENVGTKFFVHIPLLTEEQAKNQKKD